MTERERTMQRARRLSDEPSAHAPTRRVVSELEDIESVAKRWQEAEDCAVVPATATEALAATVMSHDDSALERLGGRVLRMEGLLMAVLHLEQRLQVFLQTENSQPSTYVELLQRAGGGGEPLNPREYDYLERVQGYFMSEVNPLLYTLQQDITNLALNSPELCIGDDWRVLAQPDGLWRYLQVGRVGRQQTFSVFGLMQRAQARFPHLALPDFTAPEHPSGEALGWVGETDPLDVTAHGQYWETRLTLRTDQAPRTLASAIQRRSDMLVYELQKEAEQVPGSAAALKKLDRLQATDSPDSPVELSAEEQTSLRRYQALRVVAGWTEDHSAGLRDTMTGPELQVYRAGLHFAHGDPTAVIGLLNAAEIIKETDPLLFLRIVGVAPGHDYSARTAQRSDLFGTVFHLALYRSLHLPVTADNEGMTIVQERARALLNFSTTLPDLLSISEEQMRVIERRFKEEAAAVPVENFGVAAVVFTAAFLNILPGYKMRRDLEKMLAAVSLEEREQTLNRLRTASPREFIQLMTELADVLTTDPEVQEVVYQRLKPESLNEWVWTTNAASDHPRHTERDYTDRVTTVKHLKAAVIYRATHRDLDYSTVGALRYRLWETAPTERVLDGRELYDDLMRTALYVQSRGGLAYNRIPEQQQAVQPFFAVGAAHPELTHADWLCWYDRLVVAEAQISTGVIRSRYQAREKKLGRFLPVPETMASVFQALSVARAAVTDSTVFAIRQRQVTLPERGPSKLEPGVMMGGVNNIQKDLEQLYGEFYPRRFDSSERDRFKPTTKVGYRMLQRVFPPQQFIERYGTDFVRTGFEERTPSSTFRQGELTSYVEDLPEAERRALLQALCHPDNFERLGWPVGLDTPAAAEQMDQLVASLHGEQEHERYDLAYRYSSLGYEYSWRAQALNLAYFYAPGDPNVKALLSGERRIDPMLYHRAFAGAYEQTLVRGNQFALRLGYMNELRAVLARHQPEAATLPLTVDNFEAVVASLPPSVVLQGKENIRARLATHLPEEIALGEQLLETASPAEAYSYINRLWDMEVLLSYTHGTQTQAYRAACERIDAIRQRVMAKFNITSHHHSKYPTLQHPKFDRPVQAEE